MAFVRRGCKSFTPVFRSLRRFTQEVKRIFSVHSLCNALAPQPAQSAEHAPPEGNWLRVSDGRMFSELTVAEKGKTNKMPFIVGVVLI